MIDRHTGAFVLDDGERIEPTTTREELLGRPLGKLAENAQSWVVRGDTWFSCSVSGCVSEGRAWRLDLKFRNDHVFEIGLRPEAGSEETGWETWSRKAERKKVREYDVVAERWVGPSPRIFWWGRVLTELDERAGGAIFVVRYEPAMKRPAR